MKTVTVSTGKPYRVKMARGLLAEAGKELLELAGKPCTVMLMTDDTVNGLYGEKVKESLVQSGFQVYIHAFSHGEAQKNLGTWQAMLCALAENRLTRTDWIVALGGGVAGDMAGFAAATYLRGISFLQIPTTLLAMVDSSVGGKTGVNLPMGKNLVGAFYQPEAVLCDIDTLKTLPKETLLDGVAEAVKTAVLGDKEMFGWFRSGEYESRMEEVVARCVRYKAGLVAEDEHDRGNRQLLNLGHTFGHAVERLSDYQTSHGHAVAVGMVYAARLSWRMGICGKDCFEAIEQAVAGCGLPVAMPYSPEELTEAALSDKKRAGDSLCFVLPKAIGECILFPVPVEELKALATLAVGA